MSKQMNWKRAQAPRETESKYDAGTVLRNGDVVTKPMDRLATRAAAAERQWLKSNRMKSIGDKPPATRKKRKSDKGVTYFNQRPAFDDAVLAELDGWPHAKEN